MDNRVSPIGKTARESAERRERNDPEYARIKRDRERRKAMDADEDLRRWRRLTWLGIVLVWIGTAWGVWGPVFGNLGWAVGFYGLVHALICIRVRSNLLGKYGE